MRHMLVILGLLFFTPAAWGVAAERTFPFKPSQVTCAEMQMARVQRRMSGVAAGPLVMSLGTTSLWHTSTAGGKFAGLLRFLDQGLDAYNDFLAGKEHFDEADLAFDLFFKPAASVLDPRQPRAPQATLARRDSGTNLVIDHALNAPPNVQGLCCMNLPTDAPCLRDLTCPMVVNFDLAAVPGDSVMPLVPLVINSAGAAAPGLTGPLASPLPATSGEGPGIADDQLDQACGGRLTEFDTHVFEILARTIVPSGCYAVGPGDCQNQGVDDAGFNLAIFRGADPHVYRVDIFGYQYLCDDQGNCYSPFGQLALEFSVNWDDQGRLTTGTVKILPECKEGQTLGCTTVGTFIGTGVFIVPPAFPGHQREQPAAFRGAPYISVSPANKFLVANVNWTALLRRTALNQP